MTDRPVISAEVAPAAREYVAVIFKYRAAIILTFLAVVLTVAAGSFLLPPVYEADSRILVRFGRENIYRSEVGGEETQIAAVNTEEILNSEVSILTSRDLIRDVVSTLGVETLYPGKTANEGPRALDSAIDDFTDALSVDAVRKSSIIEIAFEHENPEIAARALNLLVEDFKEKHLEAYSDPKSSYFEGQLRAYAARLQAAQDALEAFKQERRVFSLDEQRSLLLAQRADLDQALKASLSRVNELRHGITGLAAQLQSVEPDVPLSTETERYRSIDDAKNQLLGLQLREQDLLRQYTERNPLVVSVREEMAIVRSFITQQEEDIKSRIRTGQNVVYQDLQKDLLRLQGELPAQEARAASVRSQLAQLEQDIPALDRTENELENLTRELELADRNYRAYEERVEAARTLEELNRQKSANISVIQAASVPSEPVRPRKALNIALAALVGLLAGLGIAFFSELSSQSLSTPESVERRLGLPVLSTIVLRR